MTGYISRLFSASRHVLSPDICCSRINGRVASYEKCHAFMVFSHASKNSQLIASHSCKHKVVIQPLFQRFRGITVQVFEVDHTCIYALNSHIPELIAAKSSGGRYVNVLHNFVMAGLHAHISK